MTAPTVAILPAGDYRLPTRDRHNPTSSHADECWVCGRGLTDKALERATYVHVVGAGDYLAANDLGDVEPAEDLGWFPVGSGCASQVPAAFRSRLR